MFINYNFFNSLESAVENRLLWIPDLISDGIGQNIINLILAEFGKRIIPIENCFSFLADNADVIQGQKNGVITFLKGKNPNVIYLDCFCYLIYLAAEKGAETLSWNIEEILVDIYYYLRKSSKRKELLEKFQVFHDKET